MSQPINLTLTDPLIQMRDSRNLNYYKTAGTVASVVLDHLVHMCVPGAVVKDLCDAGDRMVLDEVSKVSKKLKYKGIAFPTNISINHMAAHVTDSLVKISEGDLVKIDLGVHFNGFPALVGFTVLVCDSSNKLKGDDDRARVIKAVSEASKEVLNLLKPGKTNTQVVEVLDKVFKKHGCSIPINSMGTYDHVPGFSSYQMSQNVIDGLNDDAEFVHSTIIHKNNPDYEFTLEETEFIEDEVYCIDIMACSGSGVLTRSEDATNTIFKRDLDAKVLLKLKGSREVLNRFEKHRFPVSLKEQSAKTRFGIKECVSKGLLEEYPPIQDKPGTYIARVRFTAVVRKKPLLIVARSSSTEVAKLED